MKKSKKSVSSWRGQIETMLAEIDGPRDPETAADEAAKPRWVSKLESVATESAWAALPMNRAWSEAKRLGCAVGREFVTRRWLVEQFNNGASLELENTIRESARDLEADLGPDLGEEMLEQLRANLRDDPERNTALARILETAFLASVEGAADFFEGFASAVRKRADDDAVWAAICLRTSIYAVLQNNWQVVPDQRPLHVLCEFILLRIPTRLERGIRRDDKLLRAFHENVRKVCNTIGLPTGTRGRPRKKSA
jgi:hypothetical protein